MELSLELVGSSKGFKNDYSLESKLQLRNFGTFTTDENDPLRREKNLMIKEREGWWLRG